METTGENHGNGAIVAKPARQGRRTINRGIHFTPEASRLLDELHAKEDRTYSMIVERALRLYAAQPKENA
jgi:hypothetical protein